MIKLLPIFVFACSCSAFADDVHKTISHIAAGRLTRQAKQYLYSHIPDSTQYNLSDKLADISVWADHEGRSKVPESRQLHYAFMGYQNCETFNAQKHCGVSGNGKCVVTGIADYARRAVDRSLTATDRLEALAFIAHFVADAHQPFHVGFKEDRGGNSIQVRVPNLKETGSRELSLHKVWDSYLFDAYRLQMRGARRNLRDVGDHIAETFRRRGLSPTMTQHSREITSVDHAHDFAAAIVSETAIDVTCPIAYQDIRAYISSGSVLSAEYIERGIKTIEIQIMRAGTRLAQLIEALANTYSAGGSGQSKKGPKPGEIPGAASSESHPVLASILAKLIPIAPRGRPENGFGVLAYSSDNSPRSEYGA